MMEISEKTYELHLYYQKAVSAIRDGQVKYLSKMKALPFEQDLPEIEELTASEYAQLSFWARIRYKIELRRQIRVYNKALRRQKRPVDDELTKGYNAGIEMALFLLECEYKKYIRGLDKADD